MEPYARDITKKAKIIIEKLQKIVNEKIRQLKETEIYKKFSNPKTYEVYGEKINKFAIQWSNYIYYASLDVFNTLKNMIDTGVDVVKERLNENKDEL